MCFDIFKDLASDWSPHLLGQLANQSGTPGQ